MRNYIFSFKQAKALELQLNTKDLLLLHHILWLHTNRSDKSKEFVETTTAELLRALPILGIQDRHAKRILNKLAQKKLINKNLSLGVSLRLSPGLFCHDLLGQKSPENIYIPPLNKKISSSLNNYTHKRGSAPAPPVCARDIESFNKFKKAFPDRVVDAEGPLPLSEGVDVDKLITAIKDCEFVLNRKYLGYAQLVKPKTYQQIISGMWNGPDQNVQPKTQNSSWNGELSRKYTKEEINSMYASLDDPIS